MSWDILVLKFEGPRSSLLEKDAGATESSELPRGTRDAVRDAISACIPSLGDPDKES